MKKKLTLALVALITSSAFAAIPAVLPEFKDAKQLAEWRAEMAAISNAVPSTSDVRCSALDVPSAFYTGKPYVETSGGYAFKYRSYNPELARWTSEDPSGFPDGANQSAYAPIPTSAIDWAGLNTVDLNTPIQFEDLIINGVRIGVRTFSAVTKKGNPFEVYQFMSVVGIAPPNPPGPLAPNDFSMNCHGFVFLQGYLIDNDSVPTILADEYKEVAQKHAKIVVYDGAAHSANVQSHGANGDVDYVTGKDGYFGVTTTAVDGTGYNNPRFYE